MQLRADRAIVKEIDARARADVMRLLQQAGHEPGPEGMLDDALTKEIVMALADRRRRRWNDLVDRATRRGHVRAANSRPS